jgi:hypothetical protein
MSYRRLTWLATGGLLTAFLGLATLASGQAGGPYSAQIQRAIRGLTSGATAFTQLNATTICLDATNRDTCLRRDGAGYLAMYGPAGAGPWTIKIPNPGASGGGIVTDEYGFMQWTSNVFKLGTHSAIGSGVARTTQVGSSGTLQFIANDTTAAFNMNTNGDLASGSSTSAVIINRATPTIASGFSTTAPSIAGIASAFAVTIAATPGVTGTVNYVRAFGSVPSCQCTNTITNNPVQCVPTTTQAVLNGVWVAGDIVRCTSLGY